MSDPREGNVPIDITRTSDLHEYKTEEGYIIETGDTVDDDLKVARDGHTILVPQPSEDPQDPLNWSRFKKHVILFIISAAAFLPDYGSATRAVTLIPQAMWVLILLSKPAPTNCKSYRVWNISEDTVNHSQAGNVFMLGAGGVFTVALSAYYGRLPVLFWFLVVAFATAAWCAGAVTFNSFMAARILNGFFSTAAQGGGLMFINDMFFFHERALASPLVPKMAWQLTLQL